MTELYKIYGKSWRDNQFISLKEVWEKYWGIGLKTEG